MIHKYETSENTAFVDEENKLIHVVVYRDDFKRKCRSSFSFEKAKKVIKWEVESFPGENPVALSSVPFLKWENKELSTPVTPDEMNNYLNMFPDYSELQERQ